jgi:hypothetical protein
MRGITPGWQSRCASRPETIHAHLHQAVGRRAGRLLNGGIGNACKQILLTADMVVLSSPPKWHWRLPAALPIFLKAKRTSICKAGAVATSRPMCRKR